MRVFTPQALTPGQTLLLTDGAARHIQVLRMQPGQTLRLFNGLGGEYQAQILRMGRSEVELEVLSHLAIENEAPVQIHLYVGMPANERMDWLVEKATELGVASINPLQTQRSVLKLDPARASKKVLHWQAIANAACEQCGRNQVPNIAAPLSLSQALEKVKLQAAQQAFVLSLSPTAKTLDQTLAEIKKDTSFVCFSGPEGGLSPAEEELLVNAGLQPLSLGSRTLRAETAPLALLAALTLR